METIRKIRIEVYNNYAKVSKDDDYSFSVASSYYSLPKDIRKKVYGQWVTRKEIFRLYEINKNGDIILPRGLVELVNPQYVDIVSKEIVTLDKTDLNDISDELIAKILQPESGFDLRSDQITAIRKAYLIKRGILQLATGAGKTEIMAGLMKLLYSIYGFYPKTLIIEPTLHLVKDTVKRLKKYNIPASAYTSHRDINNSEVILTHPVSLGNDVEKNPDLLNGIQVILYDEGHHLRADTWFALMKSLTRVEYSIALSASIVSPDKVGCLDLKQYTIGEALAVGGSGRLLLSIPPSYYIRKGILATPVVFQLHNPANEPCEDETKWHQKVKYRLESPTRSGLASRTAGFMASLGRKSLIFVSTKTHAKRLMEVMTNMGFDCRCSFGGGVYLKWDPVSNKSVNVTESEDSMEKFKSGEFKILIATSHLLEGADVPNLDCIIILDGGKKLRKMIQEVGRGIRKTKTGKYAYLIDFSDHDDNVLNRHAQERLYLYRELIQVPDELIYTGVSFPYLKKIFLELEGIEL
ncbi:ATP-dependent helicase [Bacillus phage SP-15]|uniref:ATP-dependent helicase n=1 Tax=Bacillus phage SP-15 TaxID=1792032 RepID=A0A127AWC7_9CAUD|nr:ATP-dependent helicase [Bacillus phage SP-15]AMM44887.1 ATP-dependent helicase [Bacillus phage SP-15]